MADAQKPTKRATSGADLSAPGAPTTRAAARKAAAADAGAKGKGKREPKKVDPKAAARSGDPRKKAAVAPEPHRYTAPVPNELKVSPWWVPVLMFGFLGIGMLVIFFNYISWPFGDPSPWRLAIGLGFILAGILTATKYH